MERRLAAIVIADVVGYSKLIGLDETGTRARFRALQEELVGPSVSSHGGRIIKTMGDAFLLEFPSAVEAVSCAVEVQRELEAREADRDENQRIRFRIGINVGDIIVEGDDIHGDGVNIAARLEERSEPGGVLISGNVHEQTLDKLDVVFDDMGEQEVKNIARPVRVWQWSPSGHDEVIPATIDVPLPLPDKPSIAVLPFDNMSGDPEQDYFVDGMVEDILTTLSKIPALFVIARNSSFQYKGKSPDVRDVGRELGVRYVVEGSVRKARNRVRVTAQLVDCRDGRHVWAERYDGELEDVFDLQDRLTREIVTQLEVNLTEGEIISVWRERSGSPLVYEKFIKGRDLYKKISRQTHSQALRELEEALKINPNYTPAMVVLGYTLVDQARFGWEPDRDACFNAALAIADRGLKINPDYGEIYSIVSYARSFQRRFDEAVEAAEKAVALSPNHFPVFHMAAMTHIYAGNFLLGRDYEQQAGRLSPMDSEASLVDLARAQFHLEEFEEARKTSEHVLNVMPRWVTAQTILLASLWRLGREKEAKKLTAAINRQYPKFSVGRWSRGWPYRNAEDLAALMDPLLEAGLSE
jgi:TolB-like protein/class 3 adenylate cyclase/Tfp pilus assembly protein PilF